jgi:hypothetical protein
MFLTHEPTCVDGEDRTGWLDRYEAIARRDFTALTEVELDALIDHVRASDYPESMDAWARLGREADFAQTEHVFTGAPDLLRMFRFSG